MRPIRLMQSSLVILAACVLAAGTSSATLISSFDLGNGTLFVGEGPANLGNPVTFTAAPGPGEGPFVDASTGVGIRVFNGTGYINVGGAGEQALVNDFVYDSGPGGNGDWQVSGLNDSLFYDLYFIAPNGQTFGATNVYGGIYTTGAVSAGATGSTATFGGWQEGVNYAVLRNVQSSGGLVTGTYASNPGSANPANYGIAGVQVVAVPEPGTLTLLALGLVLRLRFRR